MLDNSTSLNPQSHYASNDTGHGAVLVQLQVAYSSGTGDQVRAMLTPDEARHPRAAAHRCCRACGG